MLRKRYRRHSIEIGIDHVIARAEEYQGSGMSISREERYSATRGGIERTLISSK